MSENEHTAFVEINRVALYFKSSVRMFVGDDVTVPFKVIFPLEVIQMISNGIFNDFIDDIVPIPEIGGTFVMTLSPYGVKCLFGGK